jgi:hypothetical protein
VCSRHAHATADQVRRVNGTGVTTLVRPARRITCATCHDAEHQR